MKFNLQKLQILVPMVIKFMGMLFLFGTANFISNQMGLGVYGLYFQSIALLMFFISLSSIGYAQSFIRKVALLSSSRKRQLYRAQHSIIFTNTCLLLPVLAFALYYILNRDVITTFLVCLIYLLVSTLRLRFSYIRTSRLVKISELPDMVLRQGTFLFLIYMFGINSESELYIFALVAFVSAYISQRFMNSDLRLLSNNRFAGFSEYKERVDKTDFKIWIFNTLVQLREFVEITVIIYIIGEAIGGQYKILMQFSLAFMAVFNSLNLINSASFAKMIELGHISKINSKASEELKSGLVYYGLILTAFLGITVYFDVFDSFALPEDSYDIFYLILLSPLINLLFGPITQLNVHWQNLNALNLFYASRILLLTAPMFFVFFNREVDLALFVCWQLSIEVLFLTGLCCMLNINHGYYPPLVLVLQRLLCRKKLY